MYYQGIFWFLSTPSFWAVSVALLALVVAPFAFAHRKIETVAKMCLIAPVFMGVEILRRGPTYLGELNETWLQIVSIICLFVCGTIYAFREMGEDTTILDFYSQIVVSPAVVFLFVCLLPVFIWSGSVTEQAVGISFALLGMLFSIIPAHFHKTIIVGR